MDITEISKDEQAIVAKAKADLAKAAAEEGLVKTWFETNWRYALAIAVGGLFLGMALGYRLGLHAHA